MEAVQMEDVKPVVTNKQWMILLWSLLTLNPHFVYFDFILKQSNMFLDIAVNKISEKELCHYLIFLEQ